MARSTLETAFDYYWRALAPDTPPPVAEYHFAMPRRWAFDFCWPDAMVAVELEGGTRQNGRHNRAQGYEKDCEKYNEATRRGWRLYRFTSNMLHSDPAACVALVIEALSVKV